MSANLFFPRADYIRMKKAALILIPIFAASFFPSFAAGRANAFPDGYLVCGETTDVADIGEDKAGETVAAGADGREATDIRGGDGRHFRGRAGTGPRPEEREEGKKRAASLISSFSTTFDRNIYARSYNIALACKNFCYYAVPAGATLSFNGVVGKRTVERGYKEAKVIENGEYVPGVGGGVCQVSTTLYNAWITAGLGVVSVRAHSLPSSYCEMSRDATVSDWIDLVLINDSGADVIVNATVTGNKVSFYVYGKLGDYTYGFESVLIRRTEPPEPVLEYVDYIEGDLESKQISPAKKGYVTELIRHVYLDGQEVEREVVRRDIYRGTAAKVLVKNSYD